MTTCTYVGLVHLLFQVPQHSGGDVVRILDDIAVVHDLQEGHGGWVDDMALVSILIVDLLCVGASKLHSQMQNLQLNRGIDEQRGRKVGITSTGFMCICIYVYIRNSG